MSKKQIVYSDLTGGINNVATKEQLNSTPRKTETPDMVNIEYLGLGGIQTMEGNTQVGDKQYSPIVGGYEYAKGNKRYMMIATQDGYVKIYNDVTNTYDEIFKFEHYSDKVSFCNVNDGIVVSNGIDDLLFYEHRRNTELQGVVSLDKDNNYILKGIQTQFGTDVKVGDYIRINNVNGRYKVESIDNDKLLTVNKPLEVKKGIEYYGFVGDEITRTLSYPHNLQVINYDNTIDENYDELKTTYTYIDKKNIVDVNSFFTCINGNTFSTPQNYLIPNKVDNAFETGIFLKNSIIYKTSYNKNNNTFIYTELFNDSNKNGWLKILSGYPIDATSSEDVIYIALKNDYTLYLIYKYSVVDEYNISQIDTNVKIIPSLNGNRHRLRMPYIKEDGTLNVVNISKDGGIVKTKIGNRTSWYKDENKDNIFISDWQAMSDTESRMYCSYIYDGDGNLYNLLNNTTTKITDVIPSEAKVLGLYGYSEYYSAEDNTSKSSFVKYFYNNKYYCRNIIGTNKNKNSVILFESNKDFSVRNIDNDTVYKKWYVLDEDSGQAYWLFSQTPRKIFKTNKVNPMGLSIIKENFFYNNYSVYFYSRLDIEVDINNYKKITNGTIAINTTTKNYELNELNFKNCNSMLDVARVIDYRLNSKYEDNVFACISVGNKLLIYVNKEEITNVSLSNDFKLVSTTKPIPIRSDIMYDANVEILYYIFFSNKNGFTELNTYLSASFEQPTNDEISNNDYFFTGEEILNFPIDKSFEKKVYNNNTEIKEKEFLIVDNSTSFTIDKLYIIGSINDGDVITTEYTVNNKDITKYTTDLVGASNVYNKANKESIINNAEQIGNYSDTNNINLSYIIPISEDTYYQFIGTYNSNENIINTNEELSTDELQYYLTDISELNAYLTNTDPDVASGENIHTPIRGTAIQYYNGRLWVGTDNGLFYSAVGLPNNWDIYSDAGVLYSIYNDSSKISALGLFSEYLTIHKQFSTYILTCNGGSDTIEVKPFSNITCESQQGWIVSNTKYFVFSKDFLDIYPLIQHTVWSDKFLGVPISQKIRNLFKKVRIGDTDKIFCVGRPKERQMIFYLPVDGYVGSNIAVIYDFQTNSWLLRQVPQNVTSAWQYDNKIYIGTESGKVLEEFKGKTFDGEPINAYYKSPWFDWAENYMQSFSEFFIELDNTEDNNFYLDTQKDGLSRTEVRNIDSNKLYGESMLWAYDDDETDVDKSKYMTWDDNNWLRATFETIRMLLPNNVFEDFQLRFFTDKLGQLFKIFKYGFRRIEMDEAPW